MLPAPARATLPDRILGATLPVDRATYAATGFGLAGLKYLAEAGALFALSGQWLSPLVFLSPLLTARLEVLEGIGEGAGWIVWALAMWNLLFAWIGVSMSVRRARDAGLSPSAVRLPEPAAPPERLRPPRWRLM